MMVPSLMHLTLITSPWLLSAIAFHGSSLWFLIHLILLFSGSFSTEVWILSPLCPFHSSFIAITDFWPRLNFKLVFIHKFEIYLSTSNLSSCPVSHISLVCYLFCKHKTHTKLLGPFTGNFILCHSWQCHHICPCQDHLLTAVLAFHWFGPWTCRTLLKTNKCNAGVD